MWKKRTGFTLIEVLVVVAIIALLIAILLPSLSRARDLGKKAVCGAHLHGLVGAVHMYVQDSKGWSHKSPNQGLWDNAPYNPAPAAFRQYGPNDSNAYWGVAYHKYSKNKEIFACPSQIRVDDWPENGWGMPYQKYFKYCSYGLNGWIANAHGQRKGYQQGMLLDSDFKRPGLIIAFQDHIEQRMETPRDGATDMFCFSRNGANLMQWRPPPVGNYDQGKWFPNSVQECFRHLKRSNTVWLDGHVSEIRETTGKGVPMSWYVGDQDPPWVEDP
ncbi:MAG: prepilin-type N-terminal cleavage/methylation domain-containing protein [Phycisphaerae bacterium]|jgi:prepilin-type N-terminal cleavage/methylation domain-containing protein/prepilin-type processing-associated H-X9-DG protein